MQIHCWVVVVAALRSTAAESEVRRAGWLDRVVQYHKHKFISDFGQLAPVNIEASIEPAPKGYVDSPEWDLESVARLLALIQSSETARPVRRSLRRVLASLPSRRRFTDRFTYKENLNRFPSIADKNSLDNLYLEYSQEEELELTSSTEMEWDEKFDNSSAVVLVRNPVEARLPSARISVQLLKDILEARAIAGRKMPPPKKVCPEDQYVDACVEAYCGPVECSQIGFPDTPHASACPDVEPTSPDCSQGCICKRAQEGFLREAGVCVKVDRCPSCRGDPHAQAGNGYECASCGRHPPDASCRDSMKLLVNGCECKEGFLFHQELQRCVSPELCPAGGDDGDVSTEPANTTAATPDDSKQEPPDQNNGTSPDSKNGTSPDSIDKTSDPKNETSPDPKNETAPEPK